MSWIAEDVAANELMRQASADLARLGHLATGWLHRDGRWYARCVKCSEPAIVAPRSFREAPVRGAAVTFCCQTR
jgi:hypothetical protein